jgi:DNA-binding XRE family transcriptional regulator
MATNSRVTLTNLRAYRIYRLLSQRDLAALAGVNKLTVQSLETCASRANFPTIRKLAKALSVTPEALAWGPAPDLPEDLATIGG